MSFRNLAWSFMGLTAIAGFILRLTGFIDEDSYWRGLGLIIILACAAILILIETVERIRS